MEDDNRTAEEKEFDAFVKLVETMSLEKASLEELVFKLRTIPLHLPPSLLEPRNFSMVVMPKLIAQFVVLANAELPAHVQLDASKLDPVFQEAIACITNSDVHKNFYRSTNYASLIEVDLSQGVPSRAPVDVKTFTWLQLQAERRLQQTLEEYSNETDPEKKALIKLTAEYYYDIRSGFLPEGFNMENWTRWRSIHYEELLNPKAPDPSLEWKRLRLTDGISLLARADMLLKELNVLDPSELTAEISKLKEHLHAIVTTKQLPHGFSIAE